MKPNAAFERDLERWLQAEAPSSEPANLHDAIIERARNMRQRPRWLATVRASSFPSPVLAIARPTVRVAYLLVLLAIVLAFFGGAFAAGVLRSDPVRPAGWTVSGAMIDARGGHTATLLRDGRVLVVGGIGETPVGSGALASAELYDPATGSWTATGSMIEGRESHTATLLPDGKVLVVGGNDLAANGAAFSLSSAELYDPVTGSWRNTGAMGMPRTSHTATLMRDGRVLVVGGFYMGGADSGSGGPPPAAEMYDPGSGSWTTTGNLIEARESHTATLLRDGRVLVAGGTGLSSAPYLTLASAELYDSRSGAWVVAGFMDDANAPRSCCARLTATLLEDGTVLVAGADQVASGTLTSANVYDPGSGTWTATGKMVGPRDRHTATLLRDGRVLVVGGWDDLTNRGNGALFNLASAELYDSRTRSWIDTATMETERAFHTATLLRDGRVLVAGGAFFPDRSNALASAELYEPGSER